jgi:hypothetical protein
MPAGVGEGRVLHGHELGLSPTWTETSTMRQSWFRKPVAGSNTFAVGVTAWSTIAIWSPSYLYTW